MDEANEKHGDSPETSGLKKEPGMSATKKKYLITIGVALILLLSVWIWKSIEINQARKTAETEKQNLTQQATSKIVETHKDHLMLLAKPFVWAIRTEMMEGNRNQVNLYLNDMVKEKNFQLIAVADNTGKIISSTNKKDEGKEFSSIGSSSALSSNTTTTENQNDSILVMTSPVMGFNNRLGTLLIKYAIPPARFE